jgi:nicotinate-nucleotide adenylyltransferase
MKIGLYFGSFNPIHIGHCIIANHIVANTSLDQVWLVVSPQNPLKPSGSLLNEYHRLHLVQVALDGAACLRVSDIEFQLPKPSYTIDTLTYLKEKYLSHQFAIIMGSDSFKNLKNWKNYEALIDQYEIYIYLRPGFNIKKTNNANIKLLDAPLLQISSTHIRENIRKRISIRFLVPEKVMEEIEQNGYYR